jgi:hypothetical protein
MVSVPHKLAPRATHNRARRSEGCFARVGSAATIEPVWHSAALPQTIGYLEPPPWSGPPACHVGFRADVFGFKIVAPRKETKI